MRCGLHMYCVSCLWVCGNTSGVYIVGFDKGFRLYTGYACCGVGYTTIRLIKFDRRNKIQDFIVFGIWTEEICVVNIQVSNKPKSSSLYRNRMLGFFIWFPSDAKINQSIKYICICLFIVSGWVLKIWFLLPVKFCWQRTMQRTFLQAITIACGKATTIYTEYIYI